MELGFFRNSNLGKNGKYNWICPVQGGVIVGDGDLTPKEIVERLEAGQFSLSDGEKGTSILVGFGGKTEIVEFNGKISAPKVVLPDIGLTV